jgi:uncharacterized membrane protein YdjX (TVP38/TMEM64 family)
MSRFSNPAARAFFKGAVLFLTLAGLVLLFEALDLRHLDAAWIDAHIREKGAAGIALYIGAGALASAVGVPRQAVSFLGGYAFGALAGTFFATAATTAGCAGGFLYARLLGRSFIVRRFGRRMERFNAFISRAPFTMTLVVRCLPVGNNAVTTLLGGISAVPALHFITGSFLGYIPQNLIFALLGSGMRVDPFWRTALSALLFALATLLGYGLYRRHRMTRMLRDDTPPHGAERE